MPVIYCPPPTPLTTPIPTPHPSAYICREERRTDGALFRVIPRQTLFEWLFNVKRDKCSGVGGALEAKKSRSLFLPLCALHINRRERRSHMGALVC